MINGVLLAVAPGFVFSLMGWEEFDGPWVRVVGVLAVEIGYYFVYAARKELSVFYNLSVITRVGVGVAFLALALSGLGPLPLLLFASVDLLSAGWTKWAMRA